MIEVLTPNSATDLVRCLSFTMSNEANAEPDKLRYFTGREAEVDCGASRKTSNSDLTPITF